jgi:histone H3/H4
MVNVNVMDLLKKSGLKVAPATIKTKKMIEEKNKSTNDDSQSETDSQNDDTMSTISENSDSESYMNKTDDDLSRSSFAESNYTDTRSVTSMENDNEDKSDMKEFNESQNIEEGEEESTQEKNSLQSSQESTNEVPSQSQNKENDEEPNVEKINSMDSNNTHEEPIPVRIPKNIRPKGNPPKKSLTTVTGRKPVNRRKKSLTSRKAAPLPPSTSSVVKKSYRHKSGSVSFMNIRKLQKNTNLVLPVAPMLRLLRYIIRNEIESSNTSRFNEFRIESSVVEPIIQVSEDFLIESLQRSGFVSYSFGRKTVTHRSFRLQKLFSKQYSHVWKNPRMNIQDYNSPYIYQRDKKF